MSSRRLGHCDRRAGTRVVFSQRGDCNQQLAAMANRRDTQSDQIIGGEFRQHRGIDVVFAECRRVLLETELA